MASKLSLYFTSGSPPARATLLLARYLKLDIEVKELSLVSGEHRTKEFSKLNPLQKVPVLVDGDFVLGESRAIMTYLVNSRKPGSDLYPKDPKARALIDQRLYYDATVVFAALATLVVSFFFTPTTTSTNLNFQRPGLLFGAKLVEQKHKDDVRVVFRVLNGFLEGSDYFAGQHLTIADFSILPSITSFDVRFSCS